MGSRATKTFMACSLAAPSAALGCGRAPSVLARFPDRLRSARSLCKAAPAQSSLALSLRDCSLFREKAYVDGAWVGAASGATFEVTDPATGEHLGSCADMGRAETDAAIAAAAAALPAWRAKTGKERRT